MPKKPVGGKAMTGAERQSRFRERQKNELDSLRNETDALKAEIISLRNERDEAKEKARIYWVLSKKNSPASPIPPDMRKRLIQLCHPDKHDGSLASVTATQWLNDLPK